jgi:hypothetical protein
MAAIILKNVRLSFPDLFKPGTPPPGSQGGPKYGGQFIFPKDSDAYKTVVAEFARVAQEKFGPNWQTIVAALAKDKKAVRDGNMNLAKDGSVRDGYAGMMYVVARNKARPAVVDNHVQPLTEDSGKPYGGCYVNAKIELYAMDKPPGGKSINATLLAVQFVRDGEAFAGGPGTADGFEDMGDEGEGAAAGAEASNLF